MNIATLSLPALLILAGSESAEAQVEASLDLGAGSISYDDAPTYSVYTATPRVSLAYGAATLAATGSFSRFDGRGWGSRGLAAASVLTPEYSHFRFEAAARAEINANMTRTEGRQYAGQLRLHYERDDRGFYVGGGAGTAWNGRFWHQVVQTEAGLWKQFRPFALRATAQRASYIPALPRNATRLSYGTVDVAGIVRRPDYEVEVGVGYRLGEAFNDEVTWTATGAYRISRHVGVMATAGSYASDPAQALPGGSYLSFGMRIFPVRPVSERPVRPRPMPSVRRSITAIPMGEGYYAVRYTSNSARSVELAASFTDWQPVPLTRVSPGVWELRIRLNPGSHRFNLRVDSGEWMVPEGVPTLNDEFSGKVGLLMAPHH